MGEPSFPPLFPTKEKSREIKAINKETVHRICSGQVVLNLATAIKELVENSLDAGATVIEIRLREYGSELIEVTDNGSGVQEEHFEGLTLKHHTSKLQEFSDLVDVETFGFRGEALSSLCALSEMTVTTRHISSVIGTKLIYDSNGRIKSKTPCARQVGTTVTLANLFSTLPVRQKEFLRNLKREFVKMTHLLYGYCLIASHAKISCVNQTKKGSRTVVITTQGSGSVKDIIACIFGSKQAASLLELKQVSPSKELLEELGITKETTNLFRLEGCISSCAHGQGRSAADRQFFYINSRPCEPPKVAKVVNEVYHQFNVHQFPFVFLNITTDRSGVDVNVTPDKRQIFLENEKLLIASIKGTLLSLYKSIPSTFQMQNMSPSLQKSFVSAKQEEPTVISQTASNRSSEDNSKTCGLSALRRNFSHGSPKSPTKANRFSNGHVNVEPLGRGTKRVIEVEKDRNGKRQMSLTSFIKKESSTTEESSVSSIEKYSFKSDQESADVVNDSAFTSNDEIEKMDVSQSDPVDSASGNVDSTQSLEIVIESSTPLMSLASETPVYQPDLHDSEIEVEEADVGTTVSKEEEDITESTEVRITTEITEVGIRSEAAEVLVKDNKSESSEQSMSEIINEKGVKLVENGNTILDEDDANIGGRKAVRLQVDMNVISEKLKRRKDRSVKSGDRSKPIVKFYAEIDPSNNKSAEQELSREISKDMFAKMAIVGQFNLGFIVTDLGDDLFIVDQHATDEKYNFETLERTTVIQNQKLVIPQTLELTPANEGLLRDNIEIFRKNGFDFKFDENGPPTRRVQLTAKPYSQNWEFGREDVDELLFMLSDAPGTMCRPSRVRAMFASRACRKSVMIGTALSKSDMRRLVNHMGEIEQPWNCPHGRPTMRHLINLEMVRKK